MNEHRHILQPYKGMNSRYRCPNPNCKGKNFVRYIDMQTGEQIADNVGRCNRETSCGYHYTPKQYFEDNRIYFAALQPKQNVKHKPIIQQKAVSVIPFDTLKGSLNTTAYEANHFVKYLVSLFGPDIASQLVGRYFIGTSKHWNGATVFWQIDLQGKVRTGKIMLYNPTTGKRVKEPYNHITWVHTALKLPEFELQQCLFGCHLLKDKVKPVAIVESEKTALIACVYLPQFLWVAVGSLSNLTESKCKVLQGRTVILFPDLNGFEKWSLKAKELSHLATFTVSDLLERKATETERKQGLDLADYLIRFDYKQFCLPQTENQKLYSEAILHLPSCNLLGSDFDRLIIQGVETKAGRLYDILFDNEGELLHPDHNLKTVEQLNHFFQKHFVPALFDEQPCLIHFYNN